MNTFFLFLLRDINTGLSYGKGRQECNGGGVVFGWLSLEWPWFFLLWESINKAREGNWSYKAHQAATERRREQAWAHFSSSWRAHIRSYTCTPPAAFHDLLPNVYICSRLLVIVGFSWSVIVNVLHINILLCFQEMESSLNLGWLQADRNQNTAACKHQVFE